MEIHHYTRASTLPLILQSGKLRFTRADHLDDLLELPFKAFHLSRQAYFVNSWVKSTIETSGQWYRYGDQHRGVRLSFKTSPFPLKKLCFELSRTYKSLDGELKSVGFMLNDLPAPFAKETMFGKGFVLLPWGDEDSFGGDVTYVENPTEYVKQFVRSTPDLTEITGGSRLCRIKATHWKDQSEFRFALGAIRGPELTYEDNPDEYEHELLNLMEKWLSSGTGAPSPDLPFIDLPIDTLMLDHMTVTLGSGISEKDREAVLQAIQSYAPNAKVLESVILAR
ncbi:DUF2971 domain-containing protein [Pseudomonas syringae pv. pisi str. PP1]|uniref:DUF2971 domain-containing protein n=1 Tax=Pseudomonas syringae TaxID=317 RepID=UPI0004632FEA|nr:DUF2971 domain-containing protein [Pseudomonas syringae]AZG88848.1 DUF2971 domain-containing protein [Pseudomonas syringae pv. pisi str. PP1]RMM22132.1 hypothetical protein ALQ81_02476 [Pseudomonas syringae pv. pisi]UZS62428.1 DUF2971 domain-containing protein [Pseudomonas syringae]